MRTPSLLLAALAATTIAAALPTGAMAESSITVEVARFHQSHPYSGRATVEYTVGGTLLASAFAEITIATEDASATFTRTGVVAGANTNTIDFASSFGGALVLTNASFTVTVNPGGVRLWENGPYWAECNAGASEPEEYGYLFWWGDTAGYCYSDATWVSSTGQQTSGSPFNRDSCPTMDKDNSALRSEGWIDSTGNLVAAHDAATAHLGTPWRMPTDAEFSALVGNCDCTWTTKNGVNGCEVRGRDDYAASSIFLPAAGYGSDGLSDSGSYGYYWSSTPADHSYCACRIHFTSGDFGRQATGVRLYGMSVRPVQDSSGCSAAGTVTYDPVTLTTPVPVPYAWLRACDPSLADECEAYEAAANATAANGRKAWACYALGLDPADPLDDFRITSFRMEGDVPLFEFNRTTNGSGVSFLPYVRPLGKADLADAWRHVPEGGYPAFRFFAVEVVPPGVESVVKLGGVQLWENGPYWAECNAGAEKPEDYGCHFWWGDTAGYVHTGSEWVSVKDGTGISFGSSGAAASTYGKNAETLLSEGYVDSAGSLAAAHDAATAHFGPPWRMPTAAEFDALIGNCTSEWIVTNGVSGRLVTGKDDYADRSIFLPAAGLGTGSNLSSPGEIGFYWSSTPEPGSSSGASYLRFNSGWFYRDALHRHTGRSVRPVRDAD